MAPSRVGKQDERPRSRRDCACAYALPLPQRRSERLSSTAVDRLPYDSKYHPLDETTRPANALKRRRLHGLSLSQEIDATDKSTTDEDEDQSPCARQRRATSTPIRHSLRLTSHSTVDYINHPQDRILREAGITGRTKSRKTRPSILGESEDESLDAEEDEDINNTLSSTSTLPTSKSTSLPNHARRTSRPTMAKTKGMSTTDYAEVYTQAWEYTIMSNPQSVISSRISAYESAWEQFAIQYPVSNVAASSRETHSNNIASDEDYRRTRDLINNDAELDGIAAAEANGVTQDQSQELPDQNQEQDSGSAPLASAHANKESNIKAATEASADRTVRDISNATAQAQIEEAFDSLLPSSSTLGDTSRHEKPHIYAKGMRIEDILTQPPTTYFTIFDRSFQPTDEVEPAPDTSLSPDINHPSQFEEEMQARATSNFMREGGLPEL